MSHHSLSHCILYFSYHTSTVTRTTLICFGHVTIDDAVQTPGIVPNASTGEFAHQQHKRANKSASGRDTAAHYARRANTEYAFNALADGIPYTVTKYLKDKKHHATVTVQPGPGCTRVLQALRRDTAGGSVAAPDIEAEGTPTPAVMAGKYQGAALWVAPLRERTVQAVQSKDWKVQASAMKQRPSVSSLLEAYRTFFGCRRKADDQPYCANSRCPDCWRNPSVLEEKNIACSRFKHGAPLKASSGLGRWRGGDIRSKPQDEYADSWAVGEGSGEDVEIWTSLPSSADAPVDVAKLTMGRILYFFEHKGNPRRNGDDNGRPCTWWVLVFDFVTRGKDNTRLADSATDHPMLTLRGRSEPKVYPAANIRRHVHLYHACPCVDDTQSVVEGAPSAAEWNCGLAPDSRGGFGGAKVWRHKYKLAMTDEGADYYLLNEHHHSISQDTFI